MNVEKDAYQYPTSNNETLNSQFKRGNMHVGTENWSCVANEYLVDASRVEANAIRDQWFSR